MNDIEQKALQTFQNNLLYLKEKHPETYKKVDILNTAIQSGRYKENFALEYKDGYFDVLDLTTQEWLYGESSIEKAKEMAKDINFKKSDGVIETFYNYRFDEKSIEAAKEMDPTVSQFVLTAPVVNFTTKLIDKNTTMKKIYKFIFFGVGLGLHIELIHKKINPYIYFIIEDNLEIFRLSLFVTDFSTIGKECELYFSIMNNDNSFKDEFDKFYTNSFIRNGYLKYCILYPEYREKIAKIQNFIVTQSSNTYLHDKLLKKNSKVVESLEKNYNFLNVTKHYGESSIFTQRPIILVAAGPTLSKKIEWLKENAPYVTIVALFMTSAILYKNNITPDIIVHVDEGFAPVKKTLDKIQDKEFFKESLFLLTPSVEMELFLSITTKEKIFMFEDRTRYRYNKGFLEAFSVGEIGYVLSLIFGAEEIYLLGLDLALDPETKQTHAEGHLSSEKQNETKDASSDNSVSLRGSEFMVKGNFLKMVPTLPLFDMSIHMVNHFTKKFKKPYQTIYNLSNGAYFIDTVAKKTDDVNLKIFEEKNENFVNGLYEFLNKNSSPTMDKDEEITFYKRIEEAKDKKKKIEIFASQRQPSIEQIQNAFVEMAGYLIVPHNKNANELAQIYIIYLENIGNYIGDFFNTNEITNQKREIKKFQKIISAQLLKLVDKYIEILENSKLVDD